MKIGFMIDTESMGLGYNSIVWDFGCIAFDLNDPETQLRAIQEYLPTRPQKRLGREVELDWIDWFADQPKLTQEALRSRCGGDDIDELLALVRSICRKITQEIESATEYEVWFARPQHDVPLIQSLFDACGEKLPWRYDKVNDLRTLMNQAGMSARSPEIEALKAGLTTHTSMGDNEFQIRCWIEATRKLRSRT